MSGRRCRSFEGISTGTLGTGVVRLFTGMEKSDAGLPVVASEPDGPHAQAFRAIAARVHEGLQVESRPAPKIVIEA